MTFISCSARELQFPYNSIILQKIRKHYKDDYITGRDNTYSQKN